MRNLIVERIESVGQLEVLILLFRSPDKPWTAAEVSANLRSSETASKNQLKRLCDAGLISVQEMNGTDTYWFPPADENIRQIVVELVALYPDMQHRFIELIYNKPRERIKRFVDAFKVGGEGKDG